MKGCGWLFLTFFAQINLTSMKAKRSRRRVKSGTSSNSLSAKGWSGLFHPLYWIMGAGVVLGGFYAAKFMQWYGDDIFITLRYVQHWLEGQGIVYNPGERVEGYTHFLWLVMLAAAAKLGIDPLEASLNLGLVSLVGVLVLYVWWSWRVQRRHLRWAFPATALALVMHFHFREWATGGLETMFFTFELSLWAAVLFGFRWPRRRRLMVAGLVHALLFMTRPDGALFAVLLNGLLVLEMWLRRRTFSSLVRDLVMLNLPTTIIVLPYLAWKIQYYGDIYPNTYYAKAAYMWHVGQGLTYFTHYFGVYWSNALWVIPWLAYNVVMLRRVGISLAGIRQLAASPSWRVINGLAFFTWAYLILFVLKVGGGFMYARFMIPLVPFFYFLFEYSALEWWSETRHRVPGWLPWMMGCMWLLLARVEVNNFYERMTQPARDVRLPGVRKGRAWKQVDGIGDEMMFYKPKMPTIRLWAESLRPYFEGLDVTVLNYGQCAFTYWARFPVVIEGFGLCDSFIARLPVRPDWRVGHMKVGPLEYYERRGVDFVFYRSPQKRRPYRQVYFILRELGGTAMRAEMLTYDKHLVRQLERRLGRSFVHADVEAMVNEWVNALSHTPIDTIEHRYRDLLGFYFNVNDDSLTQAQRRAFEKALRQHGRSPQIE